eukprot:COSAG01_NODE_994_length_12252_cov_10.271044_12_plen_176_part_00
MSLRFARRGACTAPVGQVDVQRSRGQAPLQMLVDGCEPSVSRLLYHYYYYFAAPCFAVITGCDWCGCARRRRCGGGSAAALAAPAPAGSPPAAHASASHPAGSASARAAPPAASGGWSGCRCRGAPVAAAALVYALVDSAAPGYHRRQRCCCRHRYRCQMRVEVLIALATSSRAG